MTNYITAEGARRLQEEIVELRSKKRPKIVQEVSEAAAQGDRSENAEYIYGKKKLREIDRRLHFLVKRLDAATVVDVKARADGDVAFFGAIVDIEDEDGKCATYRIVGEDEIDTPRGDISYKSPLGRALLKRRVGETVVVRKPAPLGASGRPLPGGVARDVEVTIVAVRYV